VAQLRDVPTEDLFPRADRGDGAACAELDRRGVESPVIEPGAPPIATL
jgi:hypothetical protein